MKRTWISLLLTLGLAAAAQSAERPNILWITIEDWSADLSCYGTKGMHTPHVDKLASEGIRYERAFTTSPVCSTSRSAMMIMDRDKHMDNSAHIATDTFVQLVSS